jgi:hypothetical protein
LGGALDHVHVHSYWLLDIRTVKGISMVYIERKSHCLKKKKIKRLERNSILDKHFEDTDGVEQE